MPNDKNILIIGNARLLKIALEIANEFPNLNIKKFLLDKSQYLNFDIRSLSDFPKANWLLVLAIDDFAINYSRKSLFTTLLLYGYKFHNLISKLCYISESAQIMPGVIICPGVTISSNSSIGIGCILDLNSFIDTDTKIKKFSYIKNNAKIGSNVTINSGTTIGENVCIKNGISVGQHCELLLNRSYTVNIPDRTYFDSYFPEGMVIR